MTRPKKSRESLELAGFLRRMSRALVVRARGGDLDALEALVDARDSMNAAIVAAAQALHYDYHDAHSGAYSWGDIARTLGITRQAARQRFRREGDDEE